MSYSEEEILKSSEDSGWNSSGTWNHYGSENYYTNRSSHPEYSSAWATYATLTRPSLPLKPQRTKASDCFTSGSSGIDSTGGYGLQQQQQFSKSQHHLNYASNHHPNHHHSSRHSSRRFSEDETTYLSTSTGSPSSFTHHNAHPANMQGRVTHKPLPPAKPPRNSISSKSYTSSSSSSKSSQVRQEFTQAWHKSIDLDHTLPPPEGYGNIRRSASNDVEGFASSFRHSNASNTTNNHLEYSIVPCDASIVDQFLTNHLYDEIGVHRQSRQKHQQQTQQQHQPQQQQQQQPQPQLQQQTSMASSSLSNDNLDHNRSYNHEVNLSSFTCNRLNDQLHRSRQHSSWNYSSSNAQYHQQMQEVRAAIQAEVQKHVRSRSTHHPRPCASDEQQQQNQYETPNRVRESSLDRTNSAWNNKRPLHQLQATSVQSSKPPPPVSSCSLSSTPCSRTVEQTDRTVLKPRAITDQYATVMHPPPPEVALKSIRAVIKPLHQEHKKRKRKKSTSTTIEDHFFATIDQNGKKVTVKAKTLDKIPLLKDKSVMTDPVPDELFAQSENPFAVLSRTSKVTCEDGKRSLRRTKHHQFIHVGTAERRKKKFSLTQVQDKRKENRATRDSTSNENVVEIVQQEPIIVIKPIEIEEPKSLPVAKTLSPFDHKEWEEIETLMASFESTFKRSPLPLSDPESNNRTGSAAAANGAVEKEKTAEKGVIHASLLRNKGNKSPLAPLSPGLDGVKNFLFSLDLPDYTPLLMANGFDDVRFMGPNVMESSDLHEIGIKNEQHVTKIITSARKLFPKLDLLGKKVDVTVEEWLKALHLEEYLEKFLENGFDDMSRVRKIWEVELQAVLEINKVGHRKRILANLGERLSLMTDLGLDELDFSSVVESCMRSRSKTPDTSGRKSVSSQKSPQPVNLVEAAKSKETPKQPQQQQCLASVKNGTERTFSPENVSLDQIEVGCKSSSNSALSLTIASVPQWKHDPKQLVQQRVSYTAFYLGSTLVRQLLGIESTRESIKKLKETTKDQPKIPVVVLSISYTGVQFIDGQLNQIVCEHEIRNIHCACQDTDDFKHFAYITKDHESSNHYCHVFAALNLDLATEVILTLGQAFEVAYQLALGTDINELSKIYLQVKETQLLKADSASNTNKELSTQQQPKLQREGEGEKDDSHQNGCSSLNAKSNSSKDPDPVPWPRKNLVMEQLKHLESAGESGKDQRGLNGCKGSRIRSKSTEGVVGTLSKSFEDSTKNRNNYNNNNNSHSNNNTNNKCTSTTVTTLSKSNEQQVKLQPSVNKAKPIPPAKPASLVRFPVSPAGTLGRVRRSDAF